MITSKDFRAQDVLKFRDYRLPLDYIMLWQGFDFFNEKISKVLAGQDDVSRKQTAPQLQKRFCFDGRPNN